MTYKSFATPNINLNPRKRLNTRSCHGEGGRHDWSSFKSLVPPNSRTAIEAHKMRIQILVRFKRVIGVTDANKVGDPSTLGCVGNENTGKDSHKNGGIIRTWRFIPHWEGSKSTCKGNEICRVYAACKFDYERTARRSFEFPTHWAFRPRQHLFFCFFVFFNDKVFQAIAKEGKNWIPASSM